MKITLIIPTLNEAANIAPLVKAYLALPYDIRVLVADSASPDGTALTVRRQFTGQPVTVLETGAARGRGASIVYAYQWILTNLPDTDVVAVSDADFSHDPHDFPRLIATLDHRTIVIGSRYLPTSQIVGWPWQRRLFSFLANTFCRLLLPVKVSDYTNGYRLFPLSAINSLNLAKIDADGFIHLSQELLQLYQTGFKIMEVPTTFVNRRRGQSNFKFKLVAESLLVILKLSIQSRRRAHH